VVLTRRERVRRVQTRDRLGAGERGLDDVAVGSRTVLGGNREPGIARSARDAVGQATTPHRARLDRTQGEVRKTIDVVGLTNQRHQHLVTRTVTDEGTEDILGVPRNTTARIESGRRRMGHSHGLGQNTRATLADGEDPHRLLLHVLEALDHLRVDREVEPMVIDARGLERNQEQLVRRGLLTEHSVVLLHPTTDGGPRRDHERHDLDGGHGNVGGDLAGLAERDLLDHARVTVGRVDVEHRQPPDIGTLPLAVGRVDPGDDALGTVTQGSDGSHRTRRGGTVGDVTELDRAIRDVRVGVEDLDDAVLLAGNPELASGSSLRQTHVAVPVGGDQVGHVGRDAEAVGLDTHDATTVGHGVVAVVEDRPAIPHVRVVDRGGAGTQTREGHRELLGTGRSQARQLQTKRRGATSRRVAEDAHGARRLTIHRRRDVGEGDAREIHGHFHDLTARVGQDRAVERAHPRDGRSRRRGRRRSDRRLDQDAERLRHERVLPIRQADLDRGGRVRRDGGRRERERGRRRRGRRSELHRRTLRRANERAERIVLRVRTRPVHAERGVRRVRRGHRRARQNRRALRRRRLLAGGLRPTATTSTATTAATGDDDRDPSDRNGRQEVLAKGHLPSPGPACRRSLRFDASLGLGYAPEPTKRCQRNKTDKGSAPSSPLIRIVSQICG